MSALMMTTNLKVAKPDEILDKVKGKSTFASENEIDKHLRGLRENDR